MGVVPVTIYDLWGITPQEFSDSVLSNSNHRSLSFGYATELRFHKLASTVPNVTSVTKQADSNKDTPYDFLLIYNRYRIRVEVKSARDRARTLSDGVVVTSCKLASTSSSINGYYRKPDEFDLLAINMYHVTGDFDFVYVLERDWPRVENDPSLLSTSMSVYYPIRAPVIPDITQALSTIVEGRQ